MLFEGADIPQEHYGVEEPNLQEITEDATIPWSLLNVGHKVRVDLTKIPAQVKAPWRRKPVEAIIRFVGYTHFATGMIVGVEVLPPGTRTPVTSRFRRPAGNDAADSVADLTAPFLTSDTTAAVSRLLVGFPAVTNGTVDGFTYFRARVPGAGVFVRGNNVLPLAVTPSANVLALGLIPSDEDEACAQAPAASRGAAGTRAAARTHRKQQQHPNAPLPTAAIDRLRLGEAAPFIDRIPPRVVDEIRARNPLALAADPNFNRWLGLPDAPPTRAAATNANADPAAHHAETAAGGAYYPETTFPHSAIHTVYPHAVRPHVDSVVRLGAADSADSAGGDALPPHVYDVAAAISGLPVDALRALSRDALAAIVGDAASLALGGAAGGSVASFPRTPSAYARGSASDSRVAYTAADDDTARAPTARTRARRAAGSADALRALLPLDSSTARMHSAQERAAAVAAARRHYSGRDRAKDIIVMPPARRVIERVGHDGASRTYEEAITEGEIMEAARRAAQQRVVTHEVRHAVPAGSASLADDDDGAAVAAHGPLPPGVVPATAPPEEPLSGTYVDPHAGGDAGAADGEADGPIFAPPTAQEVAEVRAKVHDGIALRGLMYQRDGRNFTVTHATALGALAAVLSGGQLTAKLAVHRDGDSQGVDALKDRLVTATGGRNEWEPCLLSDIELADLFVFYDSDADGALGPQELYDLLEDAVAAAGATGAEATIGDVAGAIAVVLDFDEDGRVGENDFREFVRRARAAVGLM